MHSGLAIDGSVSNDWVGDVKELSLFITRSSRLRSNSQFCCRSRSFSISRSLTSQISWSTTNRASSNECCSALICVWIWWICGGTWSVALVEMGVSLCVFKGICPLATSMGICPLVASMGICPFFRGFNCRTFSGLSTSLNGFQACNREQLNRVHIFRCRNLVQYF